MRKIMIGIISIYLIFFLSACNNKSSIIETTNDNQISNIISNNSQFSNPIPAYYDFESVVKSADIICVGKCKSRSFISKPFGSDGSSGGVLFTFEVIDMKYNPYDIKYNFISVLSTNISEIFNQKQYGYLEFQEGGKYLLTLSMNQYSYAMKEDSFSQCGFMRLCLEDSELPNVIMIDGRNLIINNVDMTNEVDEDKVMNYLDTLIVEKEKTKFYYKDTRKDVVQENSLMVVKFTILNHYKDITSEIMYAEEMHIRIDEVLSGNDKLIDSTREFFITLPKGIYKEGDTLTLGIKSIANIFETNISRLVPISLTSLDN